MKHKTGSILLLLGFLSAACGAPAAPASIPTSPPTIPTFAPSVLPTMAPSPQGPGSDSSTSPAEGQDAAVAYSRQDLAERLKVDLSVISMVSVEAVEWPDGCLGIQTPGIMCTMVITPGYRVILEVGGKQYEYHTNERGSVVRLATALP